MNKNSKEIEYDQNYFKNISMVIKVLESISTKGYFPNQNYQELNLLKYQNQINNFLLKIPFLNENEYENIDFQLIKFESEIKFNLIEFLFNFKKHLKDFNNERFEQDLKEFEISIFWINKIKKNFNDLNFKFR